MARKTRDPKRYQPRTLTRQLVTPEGVGLRLELGGAGTRAIAFIADFAIVVTALIAVTLLLIWLGVSTEGKGAFALAAIWTLAFPLTRNAWFILFEAGGRAATPGKRMMGLRVVARDGGRLTVPAIAARNAMREIELFLPLTFLAASSARHSADAFVVLCGLAWSGIFLLFPLFNRDRLRIGDLVAGTWVVRTVRATLAVDLGREAAPVRRVFSDATLDLYGAFELQKLAEVIRGGDEAAITTVAGTIRRKAGLPDDRDDAGFLADYYAALGARLERNLMLGRRRSDKNDRPAARR